MAELSIIIWVARFFEFDNGIEDRNPRKQHRFGEEINLMKTERKKVKINKIRFRWKEVKSDKKNK